MPHGVLFRVGQEAAIRRRVLDDDLLEAVIGLPSNLFYTYGNAVRANIFNVEVWKPALAKAGVIPMRTKGERWMASRKDGFRVLRHTYASIILEAGESVVTLARWLGHSSPTITLDHYAHFMPEAGGKGRAAVDALLGLVPECIPKDLALT
ncbi:N-6 DNA methylase [Streptomyces lateritius]|uniref:N-6 DNA methylase n=1 Tax=Streptomyces lateritius TaxID=67313 RepID=UPI0021AB3FBF|nr:N-6 DNA methylase [Streptomyces lateritius]